MLIARALLLEVITVGTRRDNGYKYCDECPDFPCDDVMEKETRYTSKYPHRESPLENLKMIREKGMEVFHALTVVL